MKISRAWWSGLSGCAGWLTVLALAVFAVGCGDIYRPVAIPIAGSPGDPQPTSYAFVVSQNAPSSGGSITQLNVPGDSAVFATAAGMGPVHAAFLPPGESRIYIANRDDDTLTTYLPSFSTLAPTTLNLPAGSHPVYLASTESGKMYVADAGTNTVGVVDGLQSALTTVVPVGNTPVALAETSDGKKLYAVNQGDGTVSVIDTATDTVRQTITVGTSPIWALFSPDKQELYVLNQGSGTVSVINATTDTLVTSLSAGTSPTHMFVDAHFNRLYVVDAASGQNLWIFDASVDPPVLLNKVSLPLANPTSVTVLANGLKAYVPSQQVTAPALNRLCPISNVPCSLAVVTVAVVNTTNNTVSKLVSLTSPVPQSLDPVTKKLNSLVCNPGNAPFTQTGGVRFPAFATAASNNNRVYISSCDAGVIHILNTTNDSLVTDLSMVPSAFPPPTSTSPPAPQQPAFVLAGP